MSYTYTINNLPQNIPTNSNTRPNQNPSWNYQNQETTTITYTQPPIKPTPTTTSLPTVPPRQTQVFIENKLGNSNSYQSYVCGVRRIPQSAVSYIIGGERGKHFSL